MTTGTNLSSLLDAYLHRDALITAADKLTYLTLGQQRIIHDAPHILATKEATISITDAAGDEYSLASDFYMLRSIWIQSQGTKLVPIPRSEFIETYESLPTLPSGPPTGYTILGYDETIGTPAFRIRFTPDPDGSYTATYWYYYMPAAVTGAATPAISAMGFDELLLWATAAIALQPKDPQGSATAEAHYQRQLDKFLSYRPMGPDYVPVLRPQSLEERPRMPLGPHYPAI